MDLHILTSAVSQPDICRCCLSTSGSFDLTTSINGANGIIQAYADMLRTCFGIKLSSFSECGFSRFICSTCTEQLKNACSFKEQVLAAEMRFKEYYNNTVYPDNKELKKSDDKYDNEEQSNDGSYLDAVNSDDDWKIPNIQRRQRKIPESNINCSKQSPFKADLECNIPLAKLSKRPTVDKKQLRKDEKNFKDTLEPVIHGDVQKGPQLKQLSERKRIIMTCETILKDTTACPFRHYKSWFQCFFCTQDFMEINTLRQHTLNTHQNMNEEIKKIKRFPRSLQIEISNLKCRHCDLTLTDVNSLRGHFVDVHKKVIYKEHIADYKVNRSPYICHLCEQQFHVFRTLTTHLNIHYANCICDVCGKSYLNSKRLKVHKRTHEHGNYPCKECGKILKTKTSAANHMESHSKRILKCQICSKPMKNYNERVKHMSLVHNITYKFTCPICSREYNIKQYLATHIRQTHGQKNKKCSECGMVFITNHGLKKHMLKHSGLKSYSCSICFKTYARNYTLKEHMRSHESDKVS